MIKTSFITNLKIVSGLLLSLFISSCSNTTKSKIELAFERYMEHNMGNPNDYLGITDITQIDSINIVQSANKLLEVNIDSVAEECGNILYGYISPTIQSFNPNILNETKRAEARDIVGKAINYIQQSLTFAQKGSLIILLRDSLTNRVKSINPKLQSNIGYKVKARIKVNGTPTIREYYVEQTAVVDSIIISENKISLTQCPKEMAEILTMMQLYGKELNELLQYRNNLLELQQRLKNYLQQ